MLIPVSRDKLNLQYWLNYRPRAFPEIVQEAEGKGQGKKKEGKKRKKKELAWAYSVFKEQSMTLGLKSMPTVAFLSWAQQQQLSQTPLGVHKQWAGSSTSSCAPERRGFFYYYKHCLLLLFEIVRTACHQTSKYLHAFGNKWFFR